MVWSHAINRVPMAMLAYIPAIGDEGRGTLIVYIICQTGSGLALQP
jgi:hypothetical protein